MHPNRCSTNTKTTTPNHKDDAPTTLPYMQMPRDNLSTVVTHQVDPKTLTPADYNPRRISAKQREALKNSLDEFGFLQPIIVNEATGVIVGGHQRLDAAIQLGLETVPVVYVNLDERREKALNIALNKISGDWDYGHLVELLEELEPTPLFDFTGFDIDEYQNIARELGSRRHEGREGMTPPPPPVPQSDSGEVYQLGEHILVVGDSTDPASYGHTEGKVRMMFTDPPYNVAFTGAGKGTPDSYKSMSRPGAFEQIKNDEFESSEDYRGFLVAFLLAALAKNDGASYLCYSSSESEAVYGAWREAGLHLSGTISNRQPPKSQKRKTEKRAHTESLLWDKDRLSIGRSHYQPAFEPILYGWHSGANNKYWIGDRTQTSVWTYPKPTRSGLHPTMKPVDLVERAIRNSSEPGDWVLDPFLGSGTTLIAAENIGRRCYGIEMDPQYADVIIRRYLSLNAGEVTRLQSTDNSSEDGWWNHPAPEATESEGDSDL